MLGRRPGAVATPAHNSGLPAPHGAHRQRPTARPTASRAQRDWREHAAALVQQHALAGAATFLVLGASATAANAAGSSAGAPPLDLVGGSGATATVPLRRSIVEDMLLKRLTDRLHSLSDSQLAELLEQLLQDDAARFPSELLQPQPQPPQLARQPQAPQAAKQLTPPREQAQVQRPQLVAPPSRTQPDAASSAAPSSSAEVVGEKQGVEGAPRGGGGTGTSGNSSSMRDSTAEPDAEVDSTQALLQELQSQLDPGSGGLGAANRAGPALALPDWLELGGGLRLVALAIVVPSLLIFTLGKVLRGGSSKAKQPEQQVDQQPEQPNVAPQSPALDKQQPGFMQLAANLFGGDKEEGSRAADAEAATDAGDVARAGAAAPTAGAAGAGGDVATSTSRLPSPALPPLPPPYAVAEAGDASAAGTAAAGVLPPPGPVLWQRRDPSASGGGGQGAASDGGVLWRRTESSEPSSQPQYQQATGFAASSSNSSSSSSGSSHGSSSSSSPVDLWRLPLDQLRSGGGASVAEPAAGAAGSIGGPGSQASQVAAAPGASGAAGTVTPAAAAPPLGRRFSSAGPQAALDNAEPAGRVGRLQRLRSSAPRPMGDEAD